MGTKVYINAENYPKARGDIVNIIELAGFKRLDFDFDGDNCAYIELDSKQQADELCDKLNAIIDADASLEKLIYASIHEQE